MDEIEKLKLNDEFNAWYNAEKVEEKCRSSAYSEGVDVGEKNKQLEIAKNLLALNIDKNTIINATGLTLNELEEISNNKS